MNLLEFCDPQINNDDIMLINWNTAIF